ncbi:MAG: hypothetical protein GF355_06870, partial [Candidatus Eisenbacteria bacterium]|nr:hypothetical protein [Candidatus Eisenbacteria bacterium]
MMKQLQWRLRRFFPAIILFLVTGIPSVWAFAAPAVAPTVSPPATLQPREGAPADVEAATVDISSGELGSWLAWTRRGPESTYPKVGVAFLPAGGDNPAMTYGAVTVPSTSTPQQVLLSPVTGGVLLIHQRLRSPPTHPLWAVRIAATGPLPGQIEAQPLVGPPSDLLNWDVTPWRSGHLLVWSRRELLRQAEFWAGELDDGGQLVRSWLLLEDETGIDPIVVRGGEGGMILWTRQGTDLMGLLLDDGGEAAGNPIPLWSVSGLQRLGRITAVAVGETYLVAWTVRALESENEEIRVGRVGVDGIVIDPAGLRVGSESLTDETALAVSGSTGLAVWWDGRDRLMGRRIHIGDTLRALDPVPRRLLDPTRTEGVSGLPQISAAAGGAGFQVAAVRRTGPIPGGAVAGEIWGQSLREDGTLLWPGGISLLQEAELRRTTLLWDGRQALAYAHSPWNGGAAYFPFALDPRDLQPVALAPLATTAEPHDPHGEVVRSAGVVQARLRRRPALGLEVCGLSSGQRIEHRVEIPLPDRLPEGLALNAANNAANNAVTIVTDGARSLRLDRFDSLLRHTGTREIGGVWGTAESPRWITPAAGSVLAWREGRYGAPGAARRDGQDGVPGSAWRKAQDGATS